MDVVLCSPDNTVLKQLSSLSLSQEIALCSIDKIFIDNKYYSVARKDYSVNSNSLTIWLTSYRY